MSQKGFRVCRDLMKVGLHVLKRKKIHKNHFFQLPFLRQKFLVMYW